MENLIRDALVRNTDAIRAELSVLKSAHKVILNDITRTVSADPNEIGSLHFTCYLILFGLVTDFKPDLIIELGRGPGNSTFVFNRYCQLNPDCEFHSFGLEDWDREISILSERFDNFDIKRANIHHSDLRLFDYESIITGDKRCFVFFDAHGFDATDATFSLVFPLLKDRPHLVVVDDIWDGRYDYTTDIGGCPNPAMWANRGYHGKSLWNGAKIPITSTIRLGNLESIHEEAILLYDFACRNQLPVHTVRHAFEMWRTEHPEEYGRFEESMDGLVNPDEEFQVFLCLDEAMIDELTFPAPSEKLLADRRKEVPSETDPTKEPGNETSADSIELESSRSSNKLRSLTAEARRILRGVKRRLTQS